MNKGTACDIVRSANDLENRVKVLRQLSGRLDVDKHKLDVKFSVDTVTSADIKQLFGRLSRQLDTMQPAEQSRSRGMSLGTLYIISLSHYWA